MIKNASAAVMRLAISIIKSAPLVLFLLVTSGVFAEAAASTEVPFWISQAFGTIIAAAISVVGVIISVLWARRTSINTIINEISKRHGDLALKISELVSDENENKRHAAMRRFAVAVVKVGYANSSEKRGFVYFIPINSRVTIGRDPDNDIILDDHQFLSRWHCGFSSDSSNVYIDDYISTNGTLVNGEKIIKLTKLSDGDKILLGKSELQFRYIKENTILAL